MDLKRIFGPLLTLLGIAGMIYGAFLFVNDDTGNWKPMAVFFVLGLIFFSSGMGLLKSIDPDK
jgi:hypothetical protein